MATRKNLHEEVTSGAYKPSVFQTLYMAYRPYMFQIMVLITIGLIGRLLLLSNANIIGYWVDSFCTSPMICKPTPDFLQGYSHKNYISLLAVLIGLGFAATWIFRVGFSRTSAEAVSTLYDEVTLRTSRFPISFFDQNPAGRIITRFSSDYGNVFRLFGGPLAEFISIISDLLSMLILVTIASPAYLPMVLATIGAYYFIYTSNKQKLRKARRELSAIRSPSIAHFAETTQGASTIRTFSREGIFQKRFESLDNQYQDQRLSTLKTLTLFAVQMTTLSSLLLLGTGLMAYYLVKQNILSVGSVGVAFTFIVLSGSTVMMFFDWLAQFEEAIVGVERLDQYLRLPIEPTAKLPSSRTFVTEHSTYTSNNEHSGRNATIRNSSARLDVRNLSLKYKANLPMVLKQVSFSVEPGERLGIIGRTGSGKSSLIQSIFHLYPFQNGNVGIDGKSPISDEGFEVVDLNSYRLSISLIAQDPVLFKGTLRENLVAAVKADDSKLIEVLNRVGLKDWLSNNSKGLDLSIEERGRNLSSGEKQLICMARCILQNTPIVIMDEATSNVDPQSEEILIKATEEFFKGKTQVIVAHRLSTLRNCDRVLWLDQGEIKMLGPTAKVLTEFQNFDKLLPG
jgi:ABC-type multidrug transport system fused ATPase/permease subunit